MRQRIQHCTLLVVLALMTPGLSVGPLQAGEVLLPKPTRLVSDMASVLTPQESATLEAKLRSLRDSKAAEAIVYIAPAVPESVVMEELTLRSANAWGIGDAATDNGVAVFVFMRDRKIRIEVGRGLESRISDAAARAIIEERLAPAFREGRYAAGLSAALDQIERLVRENPSSTRAATKFVRTRLGATQRITGPANAPRPKRRVHPFYPAKARSAGTQGQVHLEVLINVAGVVEDVTITRGLPDGLSEAATAAVGQWVFDPPVDAEGKPVPALIDVIIQFRL
jgi:TonB family protein